MLHYFNRQRAAFLICLLFLILAPAGCNPEEQWLDDSSGFVFGFSKDDASKEVRFYDIAGRAERVVWSGTKEAGGHLDSAGKVLYVIEPRRGQGQSSLSCRLSAFDVKSSRVLRSTRWMSWARNNLESGQLSLIKVPNRQSHFLVMNNERKGSSRSAILNADTESLIDGPDGLMDIVPDGSGFLAEDQSVMNTWHESLKGRKKLEPPAIEKLCRESLWFVDLDGIRHRMTWDESAVRRVVALYGEELKTAKATARSGDENSNSLFPNQWRRWQSDGRDEKLTDAAILLLGHHQGAMRIDVKRRSVTEAVAAEVPRARQDTESRSGNSPAPSGPIVKLKDVEYWAQVLDGPTRRTPYYVARIEARWPVEGKTKTLVDRVHCDGLPSTDKTSPDGRYAVLKYEEPKKDKDEKRSRIHYIIVDHTGNIVDSLVFEHHEQDGVVEGQPFFPDNVAEKRK